MPGPQFPLYLLGHKMLHWYPYVPVGGEMTVNCAVLSYNGAMYFGFSGDVHAAPDLRRLETLLKLSFTELREAAGVRPPRKNKKKRVHAKTQTSSVTPPTSAETVHVSIPLPSVESRREPEPTAEAEKILTQLIA